MEGTIEVRFQNCRVLCFERCSQAGLGVKNILTKESTLLLLIVAAFPTAVEIKHYEIRQNKPAKQSSHGIY